MQIANYRGTGIISGEIERLSRSAYSHSAAWWPDAPGSLTGERWGSESNGFVCDSSLGADYKPGVIVDLYEYKVPLTPEEDAKALDMACRMVGIPYDFGGLAGFMLDLGFDLGEEPGANGMPKELFCSAAVFYICAALGPDRALLERTFGWKISPGTISISPLLKWINSVTL